MHGTMSLKSILFPSRLAPMSTQPFQLPGYDIIAAIDTAPTLCLCIGMSHLILPRYQHKYKEPVSVSACDIYIFRKNSKLRTNSAG